VKLGVFFIYASAKLMTPLLWIVGLVSKICHLIIGGSEEEANQYLNQEELQKILEEQSDEIPADNEIAEYSAIAANIFGLRRKDVRMVMDALNTVPLLPSNATVGQFTALLCKTDADFIPLYHRELSNIIGIVYPRDVLRGVDTRRVREYSRPPWFVAEAATIMQILKQFRLNNENIGVVLNHEGKAIGVVKLATVLAEIFGKMKYSGQKAGSKQEAMFMLIEKTFPGDMTVGEFQAQFGALLDKDASLTLSDLIHRSLGHLPERGESIFIPPFELTVKETTLRDIKTVTISTQRV
jgi:putative hemolysin